MAWKRCRNDVKVMLEYYRNQLEVNRGDFGVIVCEFAAVWFEAWGCRI